jgi:hypothetical protein
MHFTLSEHISLLPQFWLNQMFPNLLTSIVMLRESDLVGLCAYAGQPSDCLRIASTQDS